ncbi:MAG: FAD-dependent oxidoreductase [Desulfatirhabdiaceae bacterium]
MNFVVIGGDAAGMSAASRARRTVPEMRITVIEKTRDVSFSACGMPYNIADPTRPMDDLIVRQADAFQKQGIDMMMGHTAQQIDRNNRTVTGVTESGTPFAVSYDSLLIATGASPVVPDIPGVGLPGVMVLKHLEDGRRIKSFIQKKAVSKAVIIGMGYIAMEMAEALHSRNIQVSMIKPRPALLPWMNDQLSSVILKELESKGVSLYPGVAVHRIEPAADGLMVHCDQIDLEADMVLVATGVLPNSRMAADAGLETGISQSISTDRHMQTSDPAIYAAGDCADAFHVMTGKKTWIPLALRANRAGWAAADNICGKPVELPGIVGTAVFKVFDLEVARTGLSFQEAGDAGFSPVEVVIKSRSRAHAHPGSSDILVHMLGDRSSGRLLGVQMVGREGVSHRINAPAVALHTHMTVADFTQMDLAYAPPFGPVWDPLLTAANQLVKKL